MSTPNTFLIQRKALARFRKHIPFLALIPPAIYQRLSPLSWYEPFGEIEQLRAELEEAPAIPALSQRSYTTYAGGLSRSLFRLPEAVCDTPFKARSEARRNPLQRWVSIWIKLRHE
jgi:hypothetical protein